MAERIRIYGAAAPLLLETGARTRMTEIARAACLGRSSLYHYFRSKERLILYGLEPEALGRACSAAAAALKRELSRPVRPDTRRVLGLYVEKTLVMQEFVRPALLCAIELGRDPLREGLAGAVRDDTDRFVASLREVLPDPATADELAGVLRATILGLALDRDASPETARRALRALFQRFGATAPPHPRSRLAAARRARRRARAGAPDG